MAISILKQNSLTFPWLLAQNKIPWLFPDFSLTIIFFPVFPVFQTLLLYCKTIHYWAKNDGAFKKTAKISPRQIKTSHSLYIPVFEVTKLTRLLGRPQPQMYPPVALNQYTWVNRTHKHFFLYASRPHENFEIDFTPKLSSQQHVKYGSNPMKICY